MFSLNIGKENSIDNFIQQQTSFREPQMTLVTFADLTHTGKIIDANQFPLAVGFVSAFAKNTLKDEVDVKIFKFPKVFAKFLEENEPKIACFSNYMWHEQLNAQFASRIKQHYPDVVTVFGGPNFPTLLKEQKAFLEKHPEIDFYIDGEGEVAFLELFEALRRYKFNVEVLKKARLSLPNLRYLDNGELIQTPLNPRIPDVESTIPSPYLMGLMDEFFTEQLTPLYETSRGCPYSCTFCHSGIAYESKVKRFSQERITEELKYISERVKVPSFVITDLNWGSFKEDIITAQQLADLRKTTKWPRFIAISTAKNQRDRMVEISSILKDAINIGATVQSTDVEVLKNVKRSNIGIDKSIAMAMASSKHGSNTFTEIILCLPGDTYEKHIKSVLTMMDSGMDDAAIYQFILLPGTEAGNNTSRDKYGYKTRYRVMPRCFGTYEVFGEYFSVFETHEVCVGNNTMPHEDYKKCRSFSLTISIFSNGNIFEEIFGLAQALKIPKSRIVSRIHEIALVKLKDIYDQFHKDEERNFFKSASDIEEFVARDTAVEDYINGDYGANQIYEYRAISLTERIKEITEIAIEALCQELSETNNNNDLMQKYIEELKAFILLRKSDPFDLESSFKFSSQFDFEEVEKERFVIKPEDYHIECTEFHVAHTTDKITDLNKYFTQYGKNRDGLTYFMHRHPARMMYRLASKAGPRPDNLSLQFNDNKIEAVQK
jgi:radical SAM superfamily enzyme YgiQ (UPF0313 family)